MAIVFLFYSFFSSQKSYLFVYLQIQSYEETASDLLSPGKHSWWRPTLHGFWAQRKVLLLPHRVSLCTTPSLDCLFILLTSSRRRECSLFLYLHILRVSSLVFRRPTSSCPSQSWSHHCVSELCPSVFFRTQGPRSLTDAHKFPFNQHLSMTCGELCLCTRLQTDLAFVCIKLVCGGCLKIKIDS